MTDTPAPPLAPSSPGGPSRRRLLAGAGAALLALPALTGARAQATLSDVDVAIVGGGAAGIAAARAIAAAGRSHVLLEAGEKLGGRARTDPAFGQVFDLGAGGFTRGNDDEMSLASAAAMAKLPLTSLPAGRRLFAGGHELRERDYDAFLATLGRARRDILAASDQSKDVACASVITAPGDWSATVAALLGPLTIGRTLAELSTVDLALRAALPDDTTSPIGVGALLEALGTGLSVQTHAQVTAITNAGRTHTLAIAGQRGQIRARAIVLALPAPVVAAGAVRFNPPLPARLASAYRAFPAGAIEQVSFLLPGNPLRLAPDESVLARVVAGADAPPPALLRGRVNGSDLHVLTFGGAPARDIAQKGDSAALRLARAFLDAAFGPAAGDAVREVVASRWSADPLIRGAVAAALPGQGGQRRLFAEPVQGRIFLAGEYTALNNWGTLSAAWTSGGVAAAKALRLLSAGPA